MMLIEHQGKFAYMVGRLITFAFAQDGYLLTLGDAYRSSETLKCPGGGAPHSWQQMLIHNGRSKDNKSLHLDRLAIDVNLFVNGQRATTDAYRILGEYWELLDPKLGEWGGRFGIQPEDYDKKIGWDVGHFGLRRATPDLVFDAPSV